MIPAAKLKENLKFNQNLDELIEVMKMAATLQFNQFRTRQEPRADFLSSLEAGFNLVSRLATNNIFLTPRNEGVTAIVLVSSDEGFLGELNVLLVNRLAEIKAGENELIVLGRQGAEYLEEIGMKFTPFASASEKLEYKHVEPLRDYIFKRYRKGEISKIQIIYPRFVNIAMQQIESEILLPLSLPSTNILLKDEDVLVEPNLDLVVEGWVKLWLGFRLYQILWSSKLAEFAARIMHLEASMQELKRINQHLGLEYFKYLHSLSDKTIREISASRMVVQH